MKKLVSLLVVLCMLMGVSTAFATTKPFQNPVDADMMDATIVVYMRSNQGVADDIWWWDFCREYFKINFTVTQTTSASDYKSIAFMGGDMPDVFYQLFMSCNQQIEMGEVNGFLVDLAPYITPELMPNLTRVFEAHPEYKTLLSTPNGSIYSLGSFGNANDSNMKFYINQRWLNEANLELPKTLDEFDTVLAAFKARGEDVVPMGGDLGNCPRYLANAFGYTTHAASYLTTVALLNDEPTFIYADRERFPAFMAKMKEWIDAGYFSPNLFADQVAGDEENALKAQDLVGFAQNVSNVVDTEEWTTAYFLTSDWCETSHVGRTPSAINNQSFSISSNCSEEKIQRLMSWVDWLYDFDNYQASHWGPSSEDTDWLLGLEGGWSVTKNENDRWVWSAPEVENGTYGSFGDYQNQRTQGIIGGYIGVSYDMFGDAEYPINPPTYDYEEDEHVLPYIVETYPDIRFFDPDTTLRANELATPINTYVTEQYANFISGAQEINDANLETYFAQLDALGYQEYYQIYADYYNNVVKAN